VLKKKGHRQKEENGGPVYLHWLLSIPNKQINVKLVTYNLFLVRDIFEYRRGCHLCKQHDSDL